MGRKIQYEHHGKLVWVDEDLKGKHREHCLCYFCGRFKPDEPGNCPIAKLLFRMDVAHDFVTPVYECAVYQPKEVQ